MTTKVCRSNHTLVVDTSAVMAVLLREQGWQQLRLVMFNAAPLMISAATYLELHIVLLRRFGSIVLQEAAELLTILKAVVIPVDRTQAEIASDAYRRFGKGRHPAGLNFGDCFSYALAMQLNEPLLFKGEDFSRTDVRIA